MKNSILKITKLVALIAFVFTATASFSQENVKQEKKKQEKTTSNKDVKTVCFKSNMTCNGCAGEVKRKVAYEKGVKSVETNLEDNTITVTYKTDKNSKEELAKAITKLGYEAKETTIPEEKEVK